MDTTEQYNIPLWYYDSLFTILCLNFTLSRPNESVPDNVMVQHDASLRLNLASSRFTVLFHELFYKSEYLIYTIEMRDAIAVWILCMNHIAMCKCTLHLTLPHLCTPVTLLSSFELSISTTP